VIFSHIIQGTTDSEFFKGFIEQLLPLCGRWPELKSVLIIDNISFYYIDQITQMCANTRVKLGYLLLYSPDLNPIKEFFTQLKAFIKWN
jgi:transposase